MKAANPPIQSKNIFVLALLLGSSLCFGIAVATWGDSPPTWTSQDALSAPAPGRNQSRQAEDSYGRLEMAFEVNQGQTDTSVNFLARGAGYSLFLKPTEAVIRLRNATSGSRNDRGPDSSETLKPTSDSAVATAHDADAIRESASNVLRMKLVGADDNAAFEGADELAGKVNYFTGNDASKWRTEIPTFAKVRYRHVYPGVDLVYYGNQRQLEYDFVVAPGANPGSISLRFDGTDRLELDAAGDLLLSLGGSIIRQPKPVVYQEVAGTRKFISGAYAMGMDDQVSFLLGEYDSSLPLVIDPVLVYSSYLGGSGGDQGLAIAVDSSGNAYVTGFTASTNFPTANALQATRSALEEAFVSKINAAGSALVYSTYIGGSQHERSRGIAVDPAGNVYLVGETTSADFPTANALQAAISTGGSDAFVTKLNPAGSALIYSTYLGGIGAEIGNDIAIDSAGNAYITGSTLATNFPTANPLQAAKSTGTDAFLTKINAAGTALVYSTYLGGNGNDTGNDVTTDAAGNTYFVGTTSSSNFPIANAIQSTFGGQDDAFMTKVNVTGSALVYSTYIGGNSQESGTGLVVDATGSAYLTGQTFSTNFPTANAFQPANGNVTNTQDAFVTRLNAAGSAFVFSTYFGGDASEIGQSIALDSSGNIYITGLTSSLSSFPTANALQCTLSAPADAFVTKFNAAGNSLIYSTYLGGNGNDGAFSIAVDSAGNAYIAGATRSTDFPTVNAIQSTFGGEAVFGDAFVSKIADTSTSPVSALTFSQATYPVNEDVTSVNLVIQRTGDLSGAVTVDFATANGTASERSDYVTALGTLRFLAGQSEITLPVLVNEDALSEGQETFTVILSNPTGGATLSCIAGTATIQITDDAVEPATNAIDDAEIFVGTHYHDFLNRQADASGQAFWSGQITACGADAGCIDRLRTSVSTAFFVSIEFQQTGYLVFRFYKETFTDSLSRPRGMPRYREFLRDTQEIGRGVVVGAPNWEAQLETNKQAFAQRWVQTSEFVSAFPSTMTGGEFVDKLFLNAETTPSTMERDAAVAVFGSGDTAGRAAALRSVADSRSVYNRQYNAAFVLAQYIGYLRRNPNDAPEPGLNYNGFDFWLGKMNQFTVAGEDVRDEQVALSRVKRAEMVRAFIVSGEYRGRFGQP